MAFLPYLQHHSSSLQVAKSSQMGDEGSVVVEKWRNHDNGSQLLYKIIRFLISFFSSVPCREAQVH